MTWFNETSAKIFASLSAGLLIVLGILYFQLQGANGTIEDRDKSIAEQRTTIAALEAEKRVQNAAIAAAGTEGERQRQAFAAAQEQGQRAIREAQGRVTVIRQTPANGCRTPPSVMGAGL